MVGGLGRFTTVVKLLAFSLLRFGISVACPAAAVKYLVDEGAKPLFYNVDEFMYGSELVVPPLARLYSGVRWAGECAFVVLLSVWFTTALVAIGEEWRVAWVEDAPAVVITTCLGVALGAGLCQYL